MGHKKAGHNRTRLFPVNQNQKVVLKSDKRFMFYQLKYSFPIAHLPAQSEELIDS